MRVTSISQTWKAVRFKILTKIIKNFLFSSCSLIHLWFSDAKIGAAGNQLIEAYQGLKGLGGSGSGGMDFKGGLSTLQSAISSFSSAISEQFPQFGLFVSVLQTLPDLLASGSGFDIAMLALDQITSAFSSGGSFSSSLPGFNIGGR